MPLPRDREKGGVLRNVYLREDLSFPEKFDHVFVQAMLHHLPPTALAQTARNIGRILRPGGYVFIYEPNMASRVGKFFYFYFLRLFPKLYRSTMEEKPDQLAFCAAWPGFVAALEAAGIERLRRSEWLFYKIYIGRRRA